MSGHTARTRLTQTHGHQSPLWSSPAFPSAAVGSLRGKTGTTQVLIPGSSWPERNLGKWVEKAQTRACSCPCPGGCKDPLVLILYESLPGWAAALLEQDEVIPFLVKLPCSFGKCSIHTVSSSRHPLHGCKDISRQRTKQMQLHPPITPGAVKVNECRNYLQPTTLISVINSFSSPFSSNK
jgi:hypothetical protein